MRTGSISSIFVAFISDHLYQQYWKTSKAYTGRNGESEFFITKMKALVYFVNLSQLAEAGCISVEWYLPHYPNEPSKSIPNMHFTSYFNKCTTNFSSVI